MVSVPFPVVCCVYVVYCVGLHVVCDVYAFGLSVCGVLCRPTWCVCAVHCVGLRVVYVSRIL